jgi:nitrate reductase (cytochrome), electron transfer subunit
MTVPRRRYIIGFFIVLMVSAIVILDISMLHEQSEATLTGEVEPAPSAIPSEQGMFKHSVEDAYAQLPADKNHERTLQAYYSSRAFSGAPPVIPHQVLEDKTIGGKNCLQCHEKGGFSARFDAYAPITPHPELVNCRQCHVPVKAKTLFKETEFFKHPSPELGNAALTGSPPMIPHTLQLRENCLACHSGPAAPKEIRVSHPQRTYCRQCHALPNTTITWERPSNQLSSDK